MCLALPMQIKKIDGDFATVSSGSLLRKINIQMLKGPAVGDYVLVHVGFAIEKLDPERARETLALLRES